MKTKKLHTVEMRAVGDFTAAELLEELNNVPPTAKVRVFQAKSYPGEQGVEPNRLVVTWEE